MRSDIAGSARSVELLGIPAGVVTANRNKELKRRWSLLGGTVYGGSLLLGLFHIILFVFTRNLGYLMFAVYMVIQTLFFLAFRGIGFELFWPKSQSLGIIGPSRFSALWFKLHGLASVLAFIAGQNSENFFEGRFGLGMRLSFCRCVGVCLGNK